MKRKLFTLLALSCIAFSSCSGDLVPISGGDPSQVITTVSLSEAETTLKIGETKTISAAVSGTTKVTWVVGGDAAAISVIKNDLSCVVTGVSTGVATLRAIAGDGSSEMCTIKVSQTGGSTGIVVHSITLNETTKLLNANESFLLSASIDATGGNPALTWTNSNPVAVSLTKQSNTQVTIQGLADGISTITASAGGQSASCTVTVSKNESGVTIRLNKISLTLEKGKGEALYVASKPEDNPVTWQSNNPTVADVNDSGYVTALSKGTAVISATMMVSGEQRTATCNVTVTEPTQDQSEYDQQVAAWSQPGHLYMHYLRTSDSDYDKWALWIWNSYPLDAEGSLWGANTSYDLKGITPQTVGWMKDPSNPSAIFEDDYGRVIDVDLTIEDLKDGRYGYPSPLVKDWTKVSEEDLGFLIVDQTKMDGKNMWVSDGGAETYIEGFGKYLTTSTSSGSYKDGYMHVYCVEGNVSEYKVKSGKQEFVNPTATDTTGDYRSKNDISDLLYDAYKGGVATSRTFLEDRPGTGYQIFVASFCDSDGDGYGDLQGIISKLDYLQDLGIEVLWLTPIQQSNSYHGYDVTDYYKIDPRFGTLQDYQELIYRAHQRGMKVLMDMVINHTSKSNVLYKKSQKAVVETINGKTINYRDMYLWKFEGDDVREWDGVEKPADWDKTHSGQTWTANFTTVKVENSSDWYRDGTSKYFYYGKFGSGMAELNYASTATREYMTDMCKYWLSFGLDGFRLDAIKHIFLIGEIDPKMSLSGDPVYDVGYKTYYSPEILDDEGKPSLQTMKNDYSYDRKMNVMFWKQFAGAIKSAYPNCFLVGENYDGWNERIAPFYEAIDSQFDFSTYYHVNESTVSGGIVSMGGDIQYTLQCNKEYRGNHINGAFTSNHDTFRLVNHAAANSMTAHHKEVALGDYADALRRARWFAAVTILTPGVSWLYYGDELGMTGNLMDPVMDSKGKLINDPNDPDTQRDNNKDRWYRQPMKWTDQIGGETPKYQFGGNEVLWDNINSSTLVPNAMTQWEGYKNKTDKSTMFALVADLCHAKNNDAYPTYGYVTNQWGTAEYLALQISDGQRTVIAFINASGHDITIEPQNRGTGFVGGSTGASQQTIPAYGFSVVSK